jgi:hypothetical protein
MAKARNVIIVVFAIPTSTPKLLLAVKGAVEGIEAHASIFPKPDPPLADVKARLATLLAAETAFKSHTGTRTPRDDGHERTVADAKRMLAYVQGIASANPEQASVIASYATMSLRRRPTRHKAVLEVRQLVSTVVRVIAKTVPGAQAYFWQYSLDDRQTWIDGTQTTRATTTVDNLAPGTVVWFRFRALMRKTGQTDWCPPVSHLVS